MLKNFKKNLRVHNKQEIDHLKSLNKLNINLTDYLVENIKKTDKLIKIVKNDTNNSSEKNAAFSFANLHFHD